MTFSMCPWIKYQDCLQHLMLRQDCIGNYSFFMNVCEVFVMGILDWGYTRMQISAALTYISEITEHLMNYLNIISFTGLQKYFLKNLPLLCNFKYDWHICAWMYACSSFYIRGDLTSLLKTLVHLDPSFLLVWPTLCFSQSPHHVHGALALALWAWRLHITHLLQGFC